MRRIWFLLFLIPTSIYAQNVSLLSRQDIGLSGTGGAKIAAGACNAAAAVRWTGWINVSIQRNIVLDIDFVDADASSTSLDVTCESSRVNTTAQGAGRDLPVITATSNAAVTRGTSTIPFQHTWSFVAPNNVVANPGTFSTVLFIENIPAPFIACLFVCAGVPAAADTITVFARGVNP